MTDEARRQLADTLVLSLDAVIEAIAQRTMVLVLGQLQRLPEGVVAATPAAEAPRGGVVTPLDSRRPRPSSSEPLLSDGQLRAIQSCDRKNAQQVGEALRQVVGDDNFPIEQLSKREASAVLDTIGEMTGYQRDNNASGRRTSSGRGGYR